MRAKGKSNARLGKTAGEVVGAIVLAPIPRVIVVVIVITSRRTVMPVVIISRPVIIVALVALVVIPRTVVLVPPTVTIMMIPSEVRSIVVMVRVMVATASPGGPGTEQNGNGQNYKKFH
jgi:hypothetical protein